MENHELEDYWKQVEKVGREECLSDEEMLVLGNVFGQMKAEIERLKYVISIEWD